MQRESCKINKVNYQKVLDEIIDKVSKDKYIPKLLLHSCCAPCSSYVLEYLSSYFEITVFYYNPNIYPEKEYNVREKEQQKFISDCSFKNSVYFAAGNYDNNRFYDLARDKGDEAEGGERCFLCYELRLRESACYAKAHGFDYFTTTLSISPYKNADKLNQIGRQLEEEYGVKYLFSDFKKKNGYKRSIELSNQYNLYRQDYCGCVYSKNEMLRKTAEQEK